MSKKNKRDGKHSEEKKKPIDQPLPQPSPLPEKVNTARKEAHVNFWVPEELMEQLKIKAAKSRMTIKQIGIEAFEKYLSE